MGNPPQNHRKTTGFNWKTTGKPCEYGQRCHRKLPETRGMASGKGLHKSGKIHHVPKRVNPLFQLGHGQQLCYRLSKRITTMVPGDPPWLPMNAADVDDDLHGRHGRGTSCRVRAVSSILRKRLLGVDVRNKCHPSSIQHC